MRYSTRYIDEALSSANPVPDAGILAGGPAVTALVERIEASPTEPKETGLPAARGPRRRPRRVAWLALNVGLAAAVLLGLVASGTLGTGKTGKPGPTVAVPAGGQWRTVSFDGPGNAPFSAVASQPPSPASITCPTVSVCYADSLGGNLRSAAYVSRDGGSTWQPLALPEGYALNGAFSCPTATSCMAAGSTVPGSGHVPGPVLVATADGGAHWSVRAFEGLGGSGPVVINHGGVGRLQCSTVDSCVAVGSTESEQLAQPGNDRLDRVSDTVFLRTTDGGAHWSSYRFPWVATPDGQPAWSDVEGGPFACLSATSCIGVVTVFSGVPTSSAGRPAVQYSSLLVWSSSDGGLSWSRHWIDVRGDNYPQDFGMQLSCPDATHCVLPVGLGVYLWTSNAGQTWHVEPAPGRPRTAPDRPRTAADRVQAPHVRCVTDEECFAGGVSDPAHGSRTGVIYETNDAGETWQPVHLPPGAVGVDDLSCASPSGCFALARTQTSTRTGGEWYPNYEVLTNSPPPGGTAAST
ncbi:MAG: hypothetical protein ACRDY2_13195 [Acidimicrobiales bacterium]